MSLSFNPVAGAASYRLSNPCVLSVIALHASLKVFSMSSMSELRQRSALLTGYLDFLLHTVKVGNNNETIVPGFITIMTPSNPEERGCQLSLKFPSRSVISTSSKSIMMHVFDELGREGVIVDERKPDVIRVAPTPLYNTFMDVWKCVNVIARALSSVREK